MIYADTNKEDSAMACTDVGDCFLDGYGCFRDEKQAFRWYQKAVDYADGREGVMDYAFAKLLGLAEKESCCDILYKSIFEQVINLAKESDFFAYYVGECYERGIGTKENKEEAIRWYQVEGDYNYLAYRNKEAIERCKKADI